MRKIVCLYLILIILVSKAFAAGIDISKAPEVISVNDYASVVSDNTKIFVYNGNESLFESTDSKIVFVIVPTTGQMSIDEYAKTVYRNWGIASIGDRSSTFVLMAVEDMEYWVIVGDHLSSALTGEEIEKLLLEHMEPDFATGNFDSAVRNTFIAVSDWYNGHYNLSANIKTDEQSAAQPEEKKQTGGVLWSVLKVLLVVAVISFAGYIIIRRQLRLYAIEQRKRQRINSYRKYSRRSPGSGDYEYFEFYDTKD